MSGDAVEMGPVGTGASNPPGVPTAVDGKLTGFPGDEEYIWLYRPRGQPRDFQCGSGQCVRCHVNPLVFALSTFVIWLAIIWAAANKKSFEREFNKMNGDITKYWSWLYVASINIFGIFCAFLCFSRYGDIILAPADSPDPDFSYYSWFSMLFSAGVGIGLFFYGVSEPMYFFANMTRDSVNFLKTGDEMCSTEHQWSNPIKCFTPESRYDRAMSAMNIAWFDWGFAASACYVVFGLPLAFYHYRYQMPLTIRSSFYPLIGNRINGWFGDIVDAFCIVGTVFGVCTSLGLGVSQMVVGIIVMDDSVKNKVGTQIFVICCITAVATISVVTGLDVGIRRLSEMNFTIGIFLLCLVFYMGEPEFYLDYFVQMIGYHFNMLPKTSTYLGAFERHVGIAPDSTLGQVDSTLNSIEAYPAGFESWWTIFYWGWWISWSPFVGTFLARISKGRSIREFVIGNMIVPTMLTSIWFTIFGGTGIMMAFEAENLGLDCCPDYISVGSGDDAKDVKTDSARWQDWPKNKALCEGAFATWKLTATCVGPYNPCNDMKFTNIACRIASDGLYACGGGAQGINWNDVTSADCPAGWGLGYSYFSGSQYMLYDVLEYFWMRDFTIPVAIAGLMTYFITSSDSASAVNDMISSNGELDPPIWQRVFWAITEGLLAIVLVSLGADKDGIVGSQSLRAIQTASIVAGFPLCWIMLCLVYAMYRALVIEQAIIDGKPLPERKRWKLPFVDAFIQFFGKCCGCGSLVCTEGGPDIMGFARACIACWAPCLLIVRVSNKSSANIFRKIINFVVIVAPWIMMYIFLGLCDERLAHFDSAYMRSGKGDDGATTYASRDGVCKNPGYGALVGCMYVITAMIGTMFRSRIRQLNGISGNGLEDFILAFVFPGPSIYQAVMQWLAMDSTDLLNTGGGGATAPQGVDDAGKGTSSGAVETV